MKVALITITIAISLGSLSSLTRVAPHIGSQIRVSVHHAFIKHGYDNGRITCTSLPSLSCIDITASFGTSMIIIQVFESIITFTQVVIVPLESVTRVIGCTIGYSTGSSLSLECILIQIDTLAVCLVGTLDTAIGLHLGNLTKLLQSLCSNLQISILVKLHGVPQVKTCLASTSLCLFIHREHTLKAVAAQNIEHLICRRNTRTGTCYTSTSHCALCLVENIAHLRTELNQQFTILSICRNDNPVGLAIRRVDARQVVCTTCQSQSDHCYIEKLFLHCLLLYC